MAKFNPSYHSTISPEEFIRTKAEFLPLGRCLINSDYDETGTAEIVVERIHPGREITVGVYIVDLLCEGIIDTFFLFKQNKFKLIHELKEGGMSDLKECSYELVHSIIYGASKYATSLGLLDSADFTLTRYILKDKKAEVKLEEVEFGQDNRPLVLIFEDDDKAALIRKLSQTIGKGSFDIMDAGGKLIENSDEDTRQIEVLLAASYEIFGFRSANEIIDQKDRILPADDSIMILSAISSFEEGAGDAFALGQDFPDNVQARILEYIYLTARASKNIEGDEDLVDQLFTRVMCQDMPESPFDIPQEWMADRKAAISGVSVLAQKSAGEIKSLFDSANSAESFFSSDTKLTTEDIEEVYSEAALYSLAMGNLDKAQQLFDSLEKVNVSEKVGNEVFSALVDAKLEFISLK